MPISLGKAISTVKTIRALFFCHLSPETKARRVIIITRRVLGGMFIFMDALRYLSALRLYGADVLLLAAAVTLVTSLLKKTALKRASKRLFVFLPYFLGIALYCAYRMLATLSVCPLTEEWCETLQNGVAVGSAATLYYVVYEQFFRAKKEGETTPITPLLEGIVPDENVAEVSRILLTQDVPATQEERVQFVKDTLSHYDCPLGDTEREIYCNLVASYLAAVRAE